MAYPKVENWPSIYFAHNSIIQAILRLQQPQVYGNTFGFPFNFALLLMTLVLNLWVKNMPNTFSKSSKNIIKYQKIGKGEFLQLLIWNGIITPSTMTAPAASQCKNTLKNKLSALDTSAQTSLRSRPAIIVRLTMKPNYNWSKKRQQSQLSMLMASNVYRPF